MHDFAAFCRRRVGATTQRTLLELAWSRDDEGVAIARVVADAFCHSMVRALVGALLEVGDGRRDVRWPAAVLAGGKREDAAKVAPARGLTLEEVRYPDDAGLRARTEQTQASPRPTRRVLATPHRTPLQQQVGLAHNLAESTHDCRDPVNAAAAA